MSDNNLQLNGLPVLIGDDNFVPPSDFEGFTMSQEDVDKMNAAGMIKTKDITNKVNRLSGKKAKARKARKQANKSRAKNRR